MGDGQHQSMSSSRAIVECLKLEEVEKVFCVPGESYLPLLDAIFDEPALTLISARHEGGASFMGEGYAKASGTPGVVMATRGVGASNLAIGVHTAYQDSTPMVVFLGQVHSRFKGREGFQEIDLEDFFKPIAKWAVEINEASRIPEIVQRAFRLARTGRPGPVVISLPEDLLLETATMDFGTKVSKPSPRPSRDEIKDIEQILRGSKRPLIIAGGGVKSARGEETLIDFAESFNLPVMAAFRRHDVFPNDHHLYVGHLGLGMTPTLLSIVREADTLIAIGTRLSEVTTQDYTILTKGQSLIHIDIDYETIGKSFSPLVGIVADAKEALKDLTSMKLPNEWTSWASKCRVKYTQSLKPTEGQVVLNEKIISSLQKHLPKDSIITNDAGNFAGWLHRFYQFSQKNTYVGPTSGAMGYGMPAALGVKLALPDRTVVSLSGDGGFMMTMQELETAVRYDIPVISIVFNNCMYGTIRMHQEVHYPHKMIGTNLGRVDFSKIALDVGAESYYVKTAEEFDKALIQSIRIRKPSLIEIESDPNQITVSSTIQQIRNRH
ncbi:thiamine pyrophosphate-dependent enzyme [Halobacillus campisalis]|uniref:Thiamine pyrophosphate-dependent enzyme n=1 Tax=Halobacillus campisalis TaxID=435909 RepID=A0ABW2K3A2_9BACI|nr:thiamine pyrophosphate-dependent enzyme [Halobacillus campisalis]